MKLVFEFTTGDGCTFETTITIPFEYITKEDFILSILYKIDERKKECIAEYGKKNGEEWYRNGEIVVFKDYAINVGDLEDNIEHRVYQLEEWFEKQKMKV